MNWNNIYVCSAFLEPSLHAFQREARVLQVEKRELRGNMAAQTHAMVVRHAHVAFSRLLLSCERLVAADPVGVADDDFDVDESCPGQTSSSTRLRLLKSVRMVAQCRCGGGAGAARNPVSPPVRTCAGITPGSFGLRNSASRRGDDGRHPWEHGGVREAGCRNKSSAGVGAADGGNAWRRPCGVVRGRAFFAGPAT